MGHCGVSKYLCVCKFPQRSPQVHKLRLRCRLDAASVLVIHTLNTVSSEGSWVILMNEYILV